MAKVLYIFVLSLTCYIRLTTASLILSTVWQVKNVKFVNYQWKPKATVKTYSFFGLGARWGLCPTPRTGCFIPANRHGTHFTGSRMGPRTGLDRCGKFRLHRDSIPGPCSP
jgi:hypothetical protein